MHRRYYILIWFAAAVLFAPVAVLAHCPLCTAGAGAAALGAAWLGVSFMSIGIFIGAFAIATGLWVGKLVKKQYLPYQSYILAVASFATTIWPLRMILSDYTSIYISFAGEYGSFLHKTYLINKFVLGSVIGALILFAAPSISAQLSRIRGGKLFPYQGMIITFSLLFLAALVIELFV